MNRMTSRIKKQASRLKREEACGHSHKQHFTSVILLTIKDWGEIYLAGDCLGFQIFSLCRLRRSEWARETAAHM